MFRCSAAWLAGATQAQAQLVAYSQTKQVALLEGGINVDVGTASTLDKVNVASDVDGRSLASMILGHSELPTGDVLNTCR